VIPYRADDADDPTSAIPFVTIALIVANFIVFFYELSLSPDSSQLDNFIRTYSLVPCEYTLQCTQSGTPSPVWITLLTSMFLHAGWAHILGNMVFLFVFGLHVERSMGGVRYLIFYLLCGLGASAFEIAASASSSLPGLGASGAISGILAAYVVLYPGSHVRTLIPLGFFFFTARIPAWVFIGVWFAMQLIYGAASISQVNAGGVAYSAHVGGFLCGLLFVRLFAQTRRVDRLRVYHQI
jgi:rhomboid family protein